MASLVAILDLKGKPLIQRSYKDDVPPSYIERFLPLVLEIEEEGQQVTPCFSNQGVNYMHIRHSNLYRESLYYLFTRSCVSLTRLSTQSSHSPNETPTQPRSSYSYIGSHKFSWNTSRNSRKSQYETILLLFMS